MARDYRLTIDVTKFKAMLIDFQAQVHQASKRGVHKAVTQLKEDSIKKIPRAPKAPKVGGTLRRSHIILPTLQIGSRFIGTMLVKTRYAASLNTGISRWGTPYKFKTAGTGAFWIETKIQRYWKDYVRIAGDELPHRSS